MLARKIGALAQVYLSGAAKLNSDGTTSRIADVSDSVSTNSNIFTFKIMISALIVSLQTQ